MKLCLKVSALLVLLGISVPNLAHGQVLLYDDFTHIQDFDGAGPYEVDPNKGTPLHWVGEDITGKAPYPISTPNPNPNYAGGFGAPAATLPATYIKKDLIDMEIVRTPFPDPQFGTDPFNALKISSDGGPNRLVVVPYQYTIQPNDVLRLTVRVNSHANNTEWNNFALGFADVNQPAHWGFGNPFVISDTLIKHFAPAGQTQVAFPGAGYAAGQWDNFGKFYDVTIQYSAAKAGTAENAYQFFIDGNEFVLPKAGANPPLTKIGGVAFGNFNSPGANTRYISEWKLELVTDGEPGIVGDLNGDGFVGQDDLNLILGNWGQNVAPGNPDFGDPSGDGFVGQDDLNQVLGGWGQGTPPVAAVPEPASLLLMGLAGIGVTAYGVRRRSRS